MIYAINGSPRKNWNTGQLLEQALVGARLANRETRLINLYELDFKGCISCFACKRKGGRLGHCAMRDGISPLLEELREADGLILGSPIYWWDITAGMRAFLERFLFSNMLYNKGQRWVFPRKMPSALILTYGVKIDFMQSKLDRFSELETNLSEMLGYPMEVFHSDDAWQFDDYSRYEADLLDGAAKKKRHLDVFPLDLRRAEELGGRIAGGGR